MNSGIGQLLGTFLSSRREAIITNWMAAVNRDSKIPSSDNLTLKQLRDHLPQLLDNLSDTLGNMSNPEHRKEAGVTAAQHGEHRWKEGYDLSELIREFAHVRSAIIPHVIAFEEGHTDFGGASKEFAEVTLHRFFDAAILNSVVRCQEEQQIEKSERSPSG